MDTGSQLCSWLVKVLHINQFASSPTFYTKENQFITWTDPIINLSLAIGEWNGIQISYLKTQAVGGGGAVG
jgi:hypothetical protein